MRKGYDPLRFSGNIWWFLLCVLSSSLFLGICFLVGTTLNSIPILKFIVYCLGSVLSVLFVIKFEKKENKFIKWPFILLGIIGVIGSIINYVNSSAVGDSVYRILFFVIFSFFGSALADSKEKQLKRDKTAHSIQDPTSIQSPSSGKTDSVTKKVEESISGHERASVLLEREEKSTDLSVHSTGGENTVSDIDTKRLAWDKVVSYYESDKNLMYDSLFRFINQKRDVILRDDKVWVDINDVEVITFYSIEFELMLWTWYIALSSVKSFDYPKDVISQMLKPDFVSDIPSPYQIQSDDKIEERRAEDYKSALVKPKVKCYSTGLEYSSQMEKMAAVFTDCIIRDEVEKRICLYSSTVANIMINKAVFSQQLFDFALDCLKTVERRIIKVFNGLGLSYDKTTIEQELVQALTSQQQETTSKTDDHIDDSRKKSESFSIQDGTHSKSKEEKKKSSDQNSSMKNPKEYEQLYDSIINEVVSRVNKEFLTPDCFPFIKPLIDEVKKGADIEAWIKVEETTGIKTFAYKALYHITFDVLCSGELHLYRGILNPMKPGDKLLAIVNECLDYFVEHHHMISEEAKEQKEILHDGIAAVG